MKRIILASLVCLAGASLTACDMADKYEKVGTTPSGKKELTLICVDGVEYILHKPLGYAGYMAPHLQQNGLPYTCGR